MIRNKFSSIVSDWTHRIKRLEDLLFKNVRKSAFRFPNRIHFLLKGRFCDPAIFGQLIQNVVLKFAENQILMVLVWNYFANLRILADNYLFGGAANIERTSIFGEKDTICYAEFGVNWHNDEVPSSNKFRLKNIFDGVCQVNSLIKLLSNHQRDKFWIGKVDLVGIFKGKEFESKFFVVGHKTVVKDCESFLRIKNRMCLSFSHSSLSWWKARMDDTHLRFQIFFSIFLIFALKIWRPLSLFSHTFQR